MPLLFYASLGDEDLEKVFGDLVPAKPPQPVALLVEREDMSTSIYLKASWILERLGAEIPGAQVE